MFREKLSSKYFVSHIGTSEGTQVKYKKGNFWYKEDRHGHEGLVEYLSSKLLTFTDLDKSEYVLYEQGCVNGIPGCRSKDFLLSKGDALVTFYRLYYNEFGRNISEVISNMESMEERIEYVKRFILEICNIDITDYLKKIFTLDMIILNEDRHLNNLVVIFRQDHYECAPIFDNGVSLLTADWNVDPHFTLAENMQRVVAQPFSASHKMMFDYFGAGFSLDFDAAMHWILNEEPSRERDVLEMQLINCRDII